MEIRIPTDHSARTLDLLARLQVIFNATAFKWDDAIAGSWHRPPTLPDYKPLIDALTAAGLDPHEVRRPDHDEAVCQLRRFASSWSLQDAAAAFVAGLWSAPAAWRSALTGLLLHRAMADHPLTPWSVDQPNLCLVCGFRSHPDQIVQAWAFRLMEGTPLDGDVPGHAQVLEWLGDGRPQPTAYDRWALGAILSVIRSLPQGTRYSAAAKAIKSAGILQGADTAVHVLEDLALIGVLAPQTHPGLWERYTTYRERDQRPNVRVEVQAPLAWWDTMVGDHGIRLDVFEAVFGSLDIPRVDLHAVRPAASPPPEDTLTGGLAARVRVFTPKVSKTPASVGSGPATMGDVYAIRLQPGTWATAYVHEVSEARQRPYVRAEYLSGIFPECPTESELRDEVQPRCHGERCAYWVHSIEKTPWVRRIAVGRATPRSDTPLDERSSWGSGQDLRGMAGWHFDVG